VQIMMRVDEVVLGVVVRKWRKSIREVGRYAIGWVDVTVVCFMLRSQKDECSYISCKTVARR